jgi:succinyl-CoA:acetate CoA-transferase
MHDRIRHPALRQRLATAEDAAALIENGMTVGLSGFTRAGDAKAVPAALARRAHRTPLHIGLMTGASLGHDTDRLLSEAGVLTRRLPFQTDPTLRRAINRGDVAFIDHHLSETAELLRAGHLPAVDLAVIEAAAIIESGAIVPTMSVGNSAAFAQSARKAIVELNTSVPAAIEGLHDIHMPGGRPGRQPIALTSVSQRIGGSAISVDPDNIAAIVVTDQPDSPLNALPGDTDTELIAGHINDFLYNEVHHGRLPPGLLPLQVGIGTIANAVLHGFLHGPFENLSMYSEVLQDSSIELLDAGRLRFASASSITVSAPVHRRILERLAHYREHIVLRPQEISNSPELIRRLGVIAINTALEFDLYGNVNSTHVSGTHMMNGIGGSGDFARNAHLSIFVSKSIAKGGDISCVVPMVSHVDHTEHDVDVLVTEIGLADLRGLAPRERAMTVIAHCVHPSYRDELRDYFGRACLRGGQTPHVLEEALSWHARHRETGSLRAGAAGAAGGVTLPSARRHAARPRAATTGAGPVLRRWWPHHGSVCARAQ